MNKMENTMKKFLLFLIILIASNQAIARDWYLNVPKKSTVVLKIPKSAFTFSSQSIWSGKQTYSTQAYLVQNKLSFNGNTTWKDEWNLMQEFILTDAKPAKKNSLPEVKLENPYINLSILFNREITDIAKVFDEIVYVGSLYSFEQSQYYKNEVADKLLPKIFSGNLQKLDRNFQLQLMKAADYESNSFGNEKYKEKNYFVIKTKFPSVLNSVRVNQSQRIAYVFNNTLLSVIKEFSKHLKTIEIDGLKIEMAITSYNFVNNSDLAIDALQVYLNQPEMIQFSEAEITGQELLDKSVILVNNNRTKVDLTLQ
jgi:hypothetical protein